MRYFQKSQLNRLGIVHGGKTLTIILIIIFLVAISFCSFYRFILSFFAVKCWGQHLSMSIFNCHTEWNLDDQAVVDVSPFRICSNDCNKIIYIMKGALCLRPSVTTLE